MSALPDWPCALLTTDGDGVILDANATFARWVGLDRPALIGVRRLSDLLTVGGRILYETHVRPLLAMQGEVSEVAVDLRRADGLARPALLNATAHRSESGEEQVRIALFPADERRSYEHELLEARRVAEEAGRASELVQRRLTLIAEVNLVLSGTLNLTTALQRLAAMLATERQEHCVIITLDDEPGGHLSVAAAATAPPSGTDTAPSTTVADRLETALSDAGGGELRRTLLQLRPQVFASLDVSSEANPACALGPTAVVPVRARDRQVGILLLAREPDAREYSRAELSGLVSLAEPIGLFIDNLRLYAREHNRAVALQEALLTAVVDAPGLQIGARYLPSADGAMVGGDWYDSLVRADGTVIVSIGDVTGHDHNAAAAMGQLRGLLRTVAYTTDRSPAEILTLTDQAARGLGVAALATATVVEFAVPDAAGSRTMTWASAGHLPGAVVATDATVRLLDDKPGLMLGIDPSVVRHDHSETWRQGDTLVLYTDGLIESRHHSIDDGLHNLVTALPALANQPAVQRTPAQLCDALVASLAGGRGDDDIAVLVVRATA